MVHLGEEFLRFVVADNFLLLRVPLERSAKGVGNVAEMSRGDGPVSSLGGADGFLPALNAVQKVTRVILGEVALKRAGAKTGLKERGLRALDFAACDVHPALHADHLHAHAIVGPHAGADAVLV